MKSKLFSLFTLLSLAGFSGLVHAGETNNCLFGDSIGNLSKISRLKVSKVEYTTVKVSRISGDEKVLAAFHVQTIKDKETGRNYQMNTTFKDTDDGGNTIGWIEDVTSMNSEESYQDKDFARIVVVIGDSDFYECKLTK